MTEETSIRPPHVGQGIEWSRKCTGWDCRAVSFDTGQRRRRYLGHLTKGKLVAIPPDKRPEAVAAWVTERREVKGL